MYGHMNLAPWPSCPIQAAAPRCFGASAPGTLRSCSTARTSTQSYRPASISAVALRIATLPEAQAASCRAAGLPHSRGSTVAGIAPSCPCPVNSCPNAFPTWMDSTSSGSSPALRRVPCSASATMSEISRPSRAKFRAKSLW